MDNGQQHNQGHQRELVQDGQDFLLKKSEKLTTALYMVTDVLSEREPLKWKAREAAVDILSDITLSGTASSSERITALRNVMKKTERVIAFLDIARSAKMLSEMNAGVLKKEYAGFRDAVEREWSRTQGSGKPMWNESFFNVPVFSPPAGTKMSPENVARGGMENAQREVTSRQMLTARTSFPVERVSVPPVMLERSAEVSRTVLQSGVSQTGPRADVPQPRSVPPVNSRPAEAPHHLSSTTLASAVFSQPERSDRRKIIVALLKQKPALNVNDVAKSFPDVSEKTIQRELLAMVADGTLIKKGERRWSTYSLRQNPIGI